MAAISLFALFLCLLQLCSSALFYECGPTEHAELLETVERLSLLTFLSMHGSHEYNDDIYTRARFSLHFRQDTRYARHVVNGHFRPLYTESLATVQGHRTGNNVYISCLDVENNCGQAAEYGYLSDNDRMIVLVCLNPP